VPKVLVVLEAPRAPANAKIAPCPSHANSSGGLEKGPGIPLPKPAPPALPSGDSKCTGKLPGEFAHQLNNLLTTILGHTEFLLRRKESAEITRSRIEEIRDAAERGIRLTCQLIVQTSSEHPAPVSMRAKRPAR
jgi:hypothetical protein